MNDGVSMKLEQIRSNGWLMLYLGLAGCHYGTAGYVEHRVQQINAQPIDASAASTPATPLVPPAPAAEEPEDAAVQLDSPPATFDSSAAKFPTDQASTFELLDLVQFEQAAPSGSLTAQAPPSLVPPPGRNKFAIPRELPGADAEPIRLPPFNPAESPEKHREEVRNLYDPLPPLAISRAQSIQSQPDRGLTLADLQQTAFQNTPRLRQAAADVERSRGLAVQAGAYPNPEAGYQSDTVNTGRTAGYQGGFVAQEFVTANKLDYQQSSAYMKQRAAEIALRKARIQLASDVRRDYFKVLIALEKIRLARALVELTGQVYEAQIGLVEGGEAAPYEPLQLRVFAMQSRNAVLKFENEYLGAWRALAATSGVPDLPPAKLAGSLEAHAPQVDYQAAVSFIQMYHTDLSISQAEIAQAGYDLQLQRLRPIPNVNVQTSLFHDDTSELNDTAYSIQVGVPLPLFNRNRGNIIAAEAQIIRTRQNYSDVRNRLTAELAESFARYNSNRQIVLSYRESILPDQMRTYRGVYARFLQVGEDVDFAQVVVSQQTLFAALQDYVDALQDQWLSAVDVARVTQVDDLLAMDRIIGGNLMNAAPPAAPAVSTE